MECPKCGNKIGFSFGTCCECGYNHISNKYDWIKVWIADLDRTHIYPYQEDILIKKTR